MSVSPLPRRPSPWFGLGAAAVGIWVVGISTVLTVITWFVAEVATEEETTTPVWFAPLSSLFFGLLVVAAAGLLWRLARPRAEIQPGAAAAGSAWLLLGTAGTVLGCLRAIPLEQNEVLLGLTAVVAAGLALLLRPLRRRMRAGAAIVGSSAPPGQAWLGLAVGGVLVLPWLWAGALGGLVETVCAVAAAAALGWLAATVLDEDFFAAFAGRSRVWSVLVGGLAAGVALAPLAAAPGGLGVGVAEFVTVPAVGFALAAIATRGRPGKPAVGLAVATAALGPLAFVDPEETSLVLGLGDVGAWAALATVLSLAAALAVGAGYGVGLRPLPALPAGAVRRVAVVPVALAGLVAATGIVVYAGAGHPGFYGDRLFVVMTAQADLTGVAAIPDRTARLTETYRRLVQTAQSTQGPLRHELDRLHLRYKPYYLVNGILVDAGPALRPYLNRITGVDRVLYDQRLRPIPAPAAPERGTAPSPSGSPQWNIDLIHADQVWSQLGITGKGIVIGTSDSGVDGTHPALRDAFRGGDDSWYDPWNATRTPTDHNGHGTHTMGTAVGAGGIGVAPGARWVGCVNLDRGYGSPSRYLDCLQFMLAPFPYGGDPWHDGRPQDAPQILTNSWGCPAVEGCDPDALRPATAALAAAGVFVVVAAGNSGPGCATVTDAPAPYPDVLTVGAVDRDRTVAQFSSRGPAPDGRPKPDVSAPGVDVLSALPGNTYGELEGTSMATPHVAGVVALMWSANPRLVGDIATTTRILRQTAQPLAPGTAASCGDPTDTAGTGIVNAYAAVKAAQAAA